MAKPIKWLLGIVGVIVVLFIAAVIIVPMVIDPNDYKDEIITQVKNKTGRDLSINGDLSLAVSPTFQVNISLPAMQLSNASGFEQKNFVEISSAEASADILPLLLSKKLQVGKVELNGLKLYLTRLANGKTNWEDLTQKPDEVAALAPTSPYAGSGGSAGGAGLQSMDIGGVSASDAMIVWDDRQQNKFIEINPLNIRISAFQENTPFDVSLDTGLNMKNPDIKGTVTLASEAIIDLAGQQYRLNGLELTTDLTGDTLPGKAFNSTLRGDVVANMAADTLSVSKLSFDGYALNLTGDINGKAITSDKPNFNGTLVLAPFSPRELMKSMAIELPNFENDQVLTQAKASLQFVADNNNLTLKPLNATLDKTELSGQFSLQNFSNPAYRFNLALNAFNLDEYKVLPAEGSSSGTDSAKSSQGKTGKAQAEVPLIPVEMLRQLNVDGKLTIGELIASKARMQNVELVIKGSNGNVALAPLKADFYSGTINVQSRVDARQQTPTVYLTKTLKGVQLGDLLTDMTGKADMTGTANISANVTTRGLTQSELTRNSNGTANFSITDGIIKKMDILTNIRSAYALYKGNPMPQQQEDGTKFSEIKATSNITNGVLRNNDLTADSPIMKATGEGYVDLPKEYVDYTMQVTLLSTTRVNEETGLAEFSGKTIPYTIKGNFDSLDQKASVADIFKAKAKEKVKEKLGEKLEEKLGPGIKDLFKF